MEVSVLRLKDNQLVDGDIIKSGNRVLPGIQEGWRFNFDKLAKEKGTESYILLLKNLDQRIQGCLVFKMLKKQEPFMSYLEVAPHNRGKGKEYDRIAGCLIAFACRLSFIYGNGYFKGWLTFEVVESSEDDSIKLMSLYSSKYGAMRFAATNTMIISPENGEKKINEFLKGIDFT